ncbi:tetratricopeptide repeat protein [Chitinophaga sp. Mgbs1]|uniref:Tetratricopeptide repeat protein n=1 Tax=Chitinophaga solisilvae TaxID=1233460 RepID=A0A3S1JK34_9BACT|nr:tetratricopeptide repeat protein [Chitinophaga solisilvae]
METIISAEDELNLAACYLAVAAKMQETGEFGEAMSMIGDAEDIYRSLGHIAYLTCLHNRADINLQMGDLEMAKQQYETHLETSKVYVQEHADTINLVEFSNARAQVLRQLGHLHLREKKFAEAISFITKANRIYQQLHLAAPLHIEYYREYLNTFSSLGDILLSASRYDLAHACISHFHRLTADLSGKFPSLLDLQFDLAASFSSLGEIAVATNRFQDALVNFKQAARLMKAMLKAHHHVVEIRKVYAVTLERIGLVYLSQNKRRLTRRCFLMSGAMFGDLSAEFPDNIWYRELQSISLNRIGDLYMSFRQYDDALIYYQDSLALKSALIAANPGIIQLDNGMAVVHQNLGDIYKEWHNMEMAEKHYRHFFDIAERMQQYSSPYPELKRIYAIALGRMAMIEDVKKNYHAALQRKEESCCICRQLCKDYPLNTTYRDDLSVAYQDLGATCRQMGELRQACWYFIRYYRVSRILAAQFPENYTYRQAVAIAAKQLGEIYMEQEKYSDALFYYQQYRQRQQEIYDAGAPDDMQIACNDLAVASGLLGDVYIAMQLLPETFQSFETYYREIQALQERYPDNEIITGNLALASWKLGLCYKMYNDDEHALPLLAEAASRFSQLMLLYPGTALYQEYLQQVAEHQQIPVT